MGDKTVSITNPARIYSLDFAREVAAFFLLMQHAMNPLLLVSNVTHKYIDRFKNVFYN